MNPHSNSNDFGHGSAAVTEEQNKSTNKEKLTMDARTDDAIVSEIWGLHKVPDGAYDALIWMTCYSADRDGTGCAARLWFDLFDTELGSTLMCAKYRMDTPDHCECLRQDLRNAGLQEHECKDIAGACDAIQGRYFRVRIEGKDGCQRRLAIDSPIHCDPPTVSPEGNGSEVMKEISDVKAPSTQHQGSDVSVTPSIA